MSWDRRIYGRYGRSVLQFSSNFTKFELTLAVITISSVLAVLIITTITYIFHLAIAVVGASGAVTITSIIISIAAIILARRIVTTTATTRGGSTSTARRATRSTFTWSTVTTRIKSPGCRGRSTRPLSRSQSVFVPEVGVAPQG